jgi:SAM-dependent methyltransferase
MSSGTATPGAGGYGAGFLDHDVPLELERLRAHEEFADGGTRAAIEGRNPCPGWRCLEVGGGAGSVARWLAGRCAPGEVVVTDLETSLLSADAPNLTVLRHDVLHDDFPAASFDLVHARALLEHMTDREGVLTRMAGWTRPGGWLCVDATVSFAPPDGAQDAFQRCLEGLSRLASDRMRADIQWAVALPRALARIGLEHVDLLCTPGRVGPGGNATRLVRCSLRQFAPLLVKQGLVAEQDITECARRLDDGACTDFPFMLVSAWGQRPAAP